jgi:hypothetical protein
MLREPDFFMPGTLRVLSYRQQKAGVCDTYSHAFYMAGPATKLADSAQLAGTAAVIFPGLAVAVFCASAASRRKERPR